MSQARKGRGRRSPRTTTADAELPEALKAGVEALSGLELQQTKVHRDSERPARLGGPALAQGTDISLPPGQERNLPHEDWHVVQRRQGRTDPARQSNDGAPINDDAALEAEADAMSKRALGFSRDRSGDGS